MGCGEYQSMARKMVLYARSRERWKKGQNSEGLKQWLGITTRSSLMLMVLLLIFCW